MIIDTNTRSFQFAFIGALFLMSALCFSLAAYSWTGPTGTPPNGNVSAPINTGTASQIKNGGLSVNGLLSVGNIRALNGSSDISLGNQGGWTGINMYHGTARSYIQADASGLILDAYTGTQDRVTILGSLCLGGTCKTSLAPTQTYVSASCTGSYQSGGYYTCGDSSCYVPAVYSCTATTGSCPSGYARSGCSSSNPSSSAQPYGSNACTCTLGGNGSVTCYTYCIN